MISFTVHNMGGYKSFVTYITPIFKTPVIKSIPGGVVVYAGFLKIVLDHFCIYVEVKNDMTFRGATRNRSEPLRGVLVAKSRQCVTKLPASG
ncbi:MAG: hypothetical protein QW680_10005 [Pyrobaculum sp.]